MSSGEFTKTRYQADDGTILSVKVQEETLAAVFTPGGTNAAPTGAVTGGRARVSGSKRAYGIKTRTVTLKTDTPPEGYADISITTIPVLTPTVFNAITDESTVSYLGTSWEIFGKSREGGRG